MSKGKNTAEPTSLDNFLERLEKRMTDYTEHPEDAEGLRESRGGNPITLGPRVVSPTDWAEDQVKAAKDKATKWLERSRKPKKVPSIAALEAKAKYRNRLEEALAGGHWEAAMGRVDEDLRLRIIEAVGSSGFSQGVERHKEKVTAKVKLLHPLVAALAVELDGMPVATDSDREARMLAARRGMIAIGKKMKGL